MADLWYVLILHWDDDCDNRVDMKFFPSAKKATDYAMEQHDKFSAGYKADNYMVEELCGTGNAAYLETYFKVDVYYPGSDVLVALAACEQYKIGKVELTREGE